MNDPVRQNRIGAVPSLLPVRPRPVPGEATVGYLARVAEANGHASIRLLWHGLKTEGRLFQALELNEREQACLLGPLPGYWGTGTEVSSRDGQLNVTIGEDQKLRGLSGADFNHDRLRWCPLCLMDSSHVRGIWLLKLCCVCTEHKVLLHENCPSCGSCQPLHRTILGRCACGTRLTSGMIKAAPPPLIAVTEAMEQAFAGKIVGNKALPPFTIQQWLRLALYLGQFSETEQPARPGQVAGLHQLEAALSLMGNLAHLLDRWPDNFQILLQAIHQHNDRQVSLRKTFGLLMNVVYRQLHEPVFQFLRDVFEHYLQHHWEGLLCLRHRLFKRETITAHPQLTIKQAAKMAGSDPSLVRQLLQAELVPGYQRKTPKKRRIRAINRHQVRRIAELGKSNLTLEMAAKSLHLPERRLRLLMSEGMVKALVSRKQLKAARWRIPSTELKKLWIKPESDKAYETQKISMASILKYWRLSDKELIALVSALMTAKLKPISDSTDTIPLGKVTLFKAQIQNWLQQLRGEELPACSVDKAAKQLNIKQQVAYGLVKKGLLKASLEPGKGYRVSMEQLAEFREAYVSLVQLAKSVGTSPRKLLVQIGANPVTGPNIDGTRQYFYRIEDIPIEYSQGANS